MTLTDSPPDSAPDPTAGTATTTRPVPRRVRPRAGRDRHYLPGLDGLRAVSVAAVLLYHADLEWMRGGFLGVEVFFVISGYLITNLLITEIDRQGHLDLKRFWMRRARRLLPALALFLAVTTAVMVVFYRDEVTKMRGQLWSSLAYVTNWYEVFSGASYFEALGRAPALRHLWSLAVEEQFYLFWPIILAVVLAVCQGRRGRAALVICGLAAVSAGAMALLYEPDGDVSRIYYGTDTRAAGLLIGAAFGLVWSSELLDRVPPGRFLAELAGMGAIAGLVYLFMEASATRPFLYRGGFVVVDLLTVAAIVPLTRRGGLLGDLVLGNPLLRWLGTRSYGVYLWHWPIFTLSRDYTGEPMSTTHLVVCAALTFAIAEASYRYVELPIRQGAIGRWWHARRGRLGDTGPRGVIIGAGVVAVTALLGVAVANASPGTNAVEERLQAIEEAAATSSSNPPAPTQTTVTTTADSTAPTEGPGISVVVPPPAETTTTPPTTVVSAFPNVTAIGDSVMLGASPQLIAAYGNRIYVDAKVSRQFREAIDIVRALKAAGQLAPIVLIHLGNNGTFSDATFESLMAELQGLEVIFVTVKVPKDYEGEVNDALVRNILNYNSAHPDDQARLLDWKATIEGSDARLADGMHVDDYGGAVYANMVSTVIPVAIDPAATASSAPAA